MQQGVSVAEQASPVRGYGARLLAELGAGLRHHALLLAGGAAVFATGYFMSLLSGHLVEVSPLEFAIRYVLLAALFVGVTIVVFKFIRMALIERPGSPAAELLRWIRHDLLSPGRLANGAYGMTFVFLLMGGFTMAKNNVSRFGGFQWDEALSRLDRTLHFGAYPHDLLQGVLGTPMITMLLDRNYILWFPVLFAACFVGSFQARRSLARHRFLLALLFTWGIGGMFFAILFSSAGPVYFARVTGLADPYAAHFAYLREIDAFVGVKALEVQEQLWRTYRNVPSVSLISAMPSMHSAISVLVCIACWTHGGLLRAAVTVFTGLILVGSVHLGWHYAADAYAGIAIAVASWWLALPVSRWFLARFAPEPPLSPIPSTDG